MKVFTSQVLYYLSILIIFCFYSEDALCQDTGSFSKIISHGNFTGSVAFYVPPDAAPSEGFPLIIGLHNAMATGVSFRDMMQATAVSLGAVLACPEGADGDGTAIMPTVEWIANNYNINIKKQFLTGYATGGYPAFKTALANLTKFKGFIGIVPAISTLDVNNDFVSQIAIAIIVGKDDLMYSGVMDALNSIKQHGGTTKLIEKTGVDHTGAYYSSAEFSTDWIECYNFCLNTVLKPAVVNLLKPANNALDEPTAVSLSWEKSFNGTSYKVEISTSAGIYKSDNVTTESYDLPDLAKDTKYSWKVCAVNSSGDGPWSEVWSFTTSNDAPSVAPALLEPDNNADMKGPDILFKWQTVINATKYHFQIFEDESDILFAQDSTITSTGDFAQYTATKLKAGKKYRWRVRGYNKYGSTEWSEERILTITPNAPTAKSVLQYPADNAVNQTINIKFKWTLVTGADNYHLQVINSNDNAIFYDDSTIAKPSSGNYLEKYVNGLSPETPYTWKVRCGNKGGFGPWSNESHLTTGPASSVYEIIPDIFKSEVYPNPFTDDAVLSFSLPKNGIAYIEVYNSMGFKLDIPFENIYSAGEYKLSLKMNDFPNGSYYVKIISDNKVEIKGFIKLK